MNNLARSHLDDRSVPAWFADPHPGKLRAHEEPFPSIKHLTVSGRVLDLSGELGPVLPLPVSSASISRQIVSFVMGCWPNVAHEESVKSGRGFNNRRSGSTLT